MSCVTCCAVLLEPQLLDIMIVQFRNEKGSNHGSIPITIDCNVVAFIVFEEGFHQPIKRSKQHEGTTDRRGRSHPPQSTNSRVNRQIVRMAVTDRSVVKVS
ncbi:hypothetical protein TNCV_429521 [Trichonephila clavipes]|nr:hypothetical protein TNCV_429521 [Trichonephila clavipes]